MKHVKNKMVFAVLVSLAIVIAGSWCASAMEMEMVNINTAPVEQLMKLKRVGAKYAERIVEYREKNGPFKAPEDIMNVPGIGKKTWEVNKDRIEV